MTRRTGFMERDVFEMLETFFFAVSTVLVFTLNYDVSGIGNTLTNVALAAFIFVEAFACLSRGTCLLCAPVGSYALFTVFCMFSLLWTVSIPLSLKRVESLALLCAYFLALTNYILARVQSSDRADTYVRIIVVGSIVAAVYLLITSDWQSGTRVDQVIGDSNQASIYLSYSIPVSLYCAKKGLLPKWLSFGQVVLVFASALVMGSRTGILVVALGVLLFWLLCAWQEGIISLKNILIVAALILGICYLVRFVMTNSLAYELIGKRFESLFDILSGSSSKINENSYYERQALFDLAVSLFAGHPFIGVGIDAYAYYAAMSIRETFSHNDYLQLLSCVGIVGTAFYYSQHIYLIGNVVRTKGAVLALCSTLLIQLLISHWFVVFYYQKLECVFIALLCGVVMHELGAGCGGIYMGRRNPKSRESGQR